MGNKCDDTSSASRSSGDRLSILCIPSFLQAALRNASSSSAQVHLKREEGSSTLQHSVSQTSAFRSALTDCLMCLHSLESKPPAGLAFSMPYWLGKSGGHLNSYVLPTVQRRPNFRPGEVTRMSMHLPVLMQAWRDAGKCSSLACWRSSQHCCCRRQYPASERTCVR